MTNLTDLNTTESLILHHAHNNMTHDAQHYATAERAFQDKNPTIDLDELATLRQQEYSRIDDLGHVYLDYTGGGLYAQSQVEKHMELLLNGVYGNPHSSNPTSMAMTELDEQARNYVMKFFNADPDEYCVIFTSNASGSLRLIGESYPFEDKGNYLLTFDNHNSVNGIREYARSKGAKVTYTPVLMPDMRLDEEALLHNLDQVIPDGNNLFAFPAQSNFSGVQHPLTWIETAHEKGWDVLLDSAAFAPTNRLDLSIVKPDFVSLSFYKIFGYPTGCGALIVHRSMLSKLRRPWFAGGTVSVVSVQADAYFLDEGHAAFEDGTIDYLSIPAIEIGLRYIESIGLDAIHNRVVAFTEYLLDELTALTHDNGKTLAKVYGPITTDARGGTVSINLFDAEGKIFDDQLVETVANQFNISLRSGCFCNPGAGELALNISEAYIRNLFENSDRMTYEEYAMAVASDDGHDGIGAVRISVGLITNFNDVYQVVQLMKSFLNVKSDGIRTISGKCS